MIRSCVCRALANVIQALVQEAQESPLAPSPCEETAKSHLGGRLSANTELLAPYLGFLSLRDCEKLIFVVYKAPSLWYFVQAAQTD